MRTGIVENEGGGLAGALARYDASLKGCPVRNFDVDRRAYGPRDVCSRCGSVASGMCGVEAGASYALVQELRRLVKEPG